MIRIIFPILFAALTLISMPALAQPVEIADDAPDTYTVVRGDTLWGISGRFLKQPWRWPEVWRLNRDQIQNPHLIYPGQVIMLDRSGPYLTIGRRIGGDQRLSPQVYHEELDSALSSIPLRDIEPFLTRPIVIDDAMLDGAGTIVAVEEQRVLTSPGDTVFAKDVPTSSGILEVFRKAEPLIDPFTGELLAYEAQYLGSARLIELGEEAASSNLGPLRRGRHGGTPATLELISAVEEIGPGDRVIASERPRVFSHVPRAPDLDFEGRLVALYRGVEATGRHNVVTINLGHFDGLETGHVLALYRDRGEAVYIEDGLREVFDLPQNRYGLVFVFRVFDRVAYGLVMDSDGPVRIGDFARKP